MAKEVNMNHALRLAPLWALLLAPIAAYAAAPAASTPLAPSVAVVKLRPNFSAAELVAMPSTQIVEFPNGLRLSIADVRSLAPAAERLRAARGGTLRQPLTGPVVRVSPGTSLADVHHAPDNAVLQLPDGRRMTVAQFRSVQGLLPKGDTRRSHTTQTNRAGPAIKVARGTPPAELLKRPDTDVLESPSGKRITVGELRRFLQGDAARVKR
jgi:hypothetical protein